MKTMIVKDYLSKRILQRLEPFIREDVKEIVMSDFYKEFCEWEKQDILSLIKHYNPKVTDVNFMEPERVWQERLDQVINELTRNKE
jgi:23S rRNA U2552 (ribose-2'-O)-methylase RlmE/FtsJ